MRKSNLLVFSMVGIWSLLAGGTSWAEPTEVVLRLKEKISMESLAAAVTDPDSPRYGKFFTPEEIRALSAPSEEEYAGIVRQLKSEGLEIVHESPSHLFLTVRGERNALAAIHQRASQSIQAMDFTPAARGIASVNGLAPSQARHPHLVLRPMGSHPAQSGTQPATIRQLYGFDKIYKLGFTGKGQHIAIATYDDFYVSDVTEYYAKNGIKPGPKVDKVVFNGTPTFNMGSAAETETDAEFSGMVAPGASIHVFTSAQNSDVGELQLFTKILDDNRAKIVNYSWGSCESGVDAGHIKDMGKVFARAVAQGVNILAASGDSGSDCQQDGTAVADYPADHPNIVAVGGTTLASNNGEAAETAWSGSGGGISKLFGLPSYQAGFGGAYVKRSYPDIAFNADPSSGQPTWVHYDPYSDTVPASPSYMIIGGTSIAAPQWSGFLALVGEARKGKTLGFLNPIIYSIPHGSKSAYFHDVTSGSNGAYSASPGWDAVTGFGSMKGLALFNYLKAH